MDSATYCRACQILYGEENLMEYKTPLYDTHLEYGAKMIGFGGYLMPVQYKAGIKAEHMAVREAAGLFDICHMGQIFCRGPKALKALNMLLTNDYTNLKVGSARYANMLNEEGGIIDDVIVFRLEEDEYMIAVNASTKENDYRWMLEHNFGAEFESAFDRMGCLALQGPASEKILLKLTAEDNLPKGYYTIRKDSAIGEIPCMISRTGYTGELGYEIFLSLDDAVKMWNLILNAGQEEGLLPIGLGARDTLRLEAGMPLYGSDLTTEITPLEAGLSYGIKMEKEDFIGKQALEEKGQARICRIGLKVTGKGIVREHQDLYYKGEKAGTVTSGTYAPYLKEAIAMAYVGKEYAEEGTVLEADVRGRRVEVEVVPLPFYKRQQEPVKAKEQ